MIARKNGECNRVCLAAVIELPKHQTPIGFVTTNPEIFHARMTTRHFGVRIKTNCPVDVLIRQSGSLLVERQLKAGLHTIDRDDNQRLFATFPATRAVSVGSASCAGSGEGVTERLFAEADQLLSGLPVAESDHLIIQVRFSSVNTEADPELPEDGFATLLFRLRSAKDHLAAVAENLNAMVQPTLVETIWQEHGGENSGSVVLDCCLNPDER